MGNIKNPEAGLHDLIMGTTENIRVSELESCEVAIKNNAPLKCMDGRWREGNDLRAYAETIRQSITPYAYLDRRYGLDQRPVLNPGEYKNPSVIKTIVPTVANR